MRKLWTIILLLVVLSLGTVGYFMSKEKNTDLTKIKVAEVTHSAFYAPFYVAIENNYFSDEGLDIELILTPGADKVSAAVLSNDVNIGFCGPESSIYVYNGGEEDYIVTFAGLTKRDGQFIVSRNKIENFTLDDVKDKEVLGGRIGGMPLLNFQKALLNNNIKLSDVKINTSVEFAALVGAFIGGEGDFVNLFEPNATKLEKEGFGYVVGSVGMYSDEVPYTAFNARKSYIEKNEDAIKKFTNAINKGLDFVKNNSSEDIAKVILKQFPDTSLNDLIKIVNRYKEADSWLNTPYISEESFNNLQEIMILNKQITSKISYQDLISNYYNE